MTMELPWREETVAVMTSAYHALYEQVTDATPGWGPERDAPADTWTTAQILQVSSALPRELREKRSMALAWLSASANSSSGSWTGTFHRQPDGDVPTTANALLALSNFPEATLGARKAGADWLVRTYSNGWSPTPADTRPSEPRNYATAYAIRALLRAPRAPHRAMLVHEGLAALAESRSPGSGVWGYGPRPHQPDVTFTAYAMHAFTDARELWQIQGYDDLISDSADWLIDQRGPDGYWRDWHGVAESPEATAYALYMLHLTDKLSLSVWDQSLQRVLSLIESDRLWSLELGAGANWVSATVLMCLQGLGYSPFSEIEGRVGPSSVRRPEAGAVASSVSRQEQEILDLEDIYGAPVSADLSAIPVTKSLEHTMFRALEKYVERRVPALEVLETVLAAEGGRVQVYGVYPAHAQAVFTRLGYRNLQFIEVDTLAKTKEYNYVRPTYWTGETVNGHLRLLVSVTPGEDYVLHVSSVLRHALLRSSGRAVERLDVYRFPKAEQSIASWTNLPTSPLAQTGVVVVGYIKPIVEELNRCGLQVQKTYDSSFYTVLTVEEDDYKFSLLGVKFSFWGSIAFHIASALYGSGVREIIYFGKLGSLSAPHDLYDRIFVPTQFGLMKNDQMQLRIDLRDLPPLAKAFPNHQSGLHVSVPTVLEEDYNQRRVASDFQARSLDNEISHFAHAASIDRRFFSAVHFATDYLRGPGESTITTSADLATNRGEPELKLKSEVQAIVARTVIVPYLRGKL